MNTMSFCPTEDMQYYRGHAVLPFYRGHVVLLSYRGHAVLLSYRGHAVLLSYRGHAVLPFYRGHAVLPSYRGHAVLPSYRGHGGHNVLRRTSCSQRTDQHSGVAQHIHNAESEVGLLADFVSGGSGGACTRGGGPGRAGGTGAVQALLGIARAQVSAALEV